MRRLLPEDAFRAWFAAFLPALAQGSPQALLAPVHVCDRSDSRIAHLDGLNLTRAWAMREIAPTTGGAVRQVLETAADAHTASGDKPRMGFNILAFGKTSRIFNGRGIGERRDRSNARNSHQPSADHIGLCPVV